MSKSDVFLQKFERLAARVPGFNDYRDLDTLRETDRRTRASLAGSLESMVGDIESSASVLVTQQRYEEITSIEALIRSLRLTASQLKSAPQGYAPIFSDRVVNKAVLSQMIAFDAALAHRVAAMQTEVKQLSDSLSQGSPVQNEANALALQSRRLGQDFAAREDVLTSGERRPGRSLSEAISGDSVAAALPDALTVGDVFSIGDDDYVVDLELTVEGAQDLARFLLSDVQNRSWLAVIPGAPWPVFLGQEQEVNSDETTAGASLPSPSYQLSGTGEVIRGSERTSVGIVSVKLFNDSESSNRLLLAIESEDLELRISGTAIEADSIVIYGAAA